MIKSRPDNQFEFRPFWFSASNYFVLLIGISAILAFASWFLIHDFDDEVPVIVAISVFFVVGIIGIFVRGRLKQRVQTKILIENNKLNDRIRIRKKTNREPKLSIAANSILVSQLEKKSEAANLLGKISEVHWELFENCNDYLEMIDYELKSVGSGSPRLASFAKGRNRIKTLHKRHLLQWVENESAELASNANRIDSFSERIAIGRKTLEMLESALEFYPNEKKLKDSVAAVNEFISSTQVAEYVDNGEKFALADDFESAIRCYRDALFELASENVRIGEKQAIADRINNEISRLRNSEI